MIDYPLNDTLADFNHTLIHVERTEEQTIITVKSKRTDKQKLIVLSNKMIRESENPYQYVTDTIQEALSEPTFDFD